MPAWNHKKNMEPDSGLITYEDSFLYPIKERSTRKIRIFLQYIFFLAPSPSIQPQINKKKR